jgi:hypothetical protein
MNTPTNPHPNQPFSPLRDDFEVMLPAAAYLRYDGRADGWSAGRQAAFLMHLADNGVVADAARAVGMALSGGYALRRQARGYAFNLGWEAALLIARRIVADALMAAAIKGEQARWVREEGVTTYTRQNTKFSLALLGRVDPVASLPEVLAVVARFDWYLRLIGDGASAEDLWTLFFDSALPHSEVEARERVRASLLLCEESADFDGADVEWGGDEGDAGFDDRDSGDAGDDRPIEYKSIDAARAARAAPARPLAVSRAAASRPAASARAAQGEFDQIGAFFVGSVGDDVDGAVGAQAIGDALHVGCGVGGGEHRVPPVGAFQPHDAGAAGFPRRIIGAEPFEPHHHIVARLFDHGKAQEAHRAALNAARGAQHHAAAGPGPALLDDKAAAVARPFARQEREVGQCGGMRRVVQAQKQGGGGGDGGFHGGVLCGGSGSPL